MDFKDYYAVLGVAKTAGTEEIRKAFRALARKYHPDVAKDKKSAEEKFKEINEAYEVLGDPEKRRKYDELGMAWKEGAGFAGRSSAKGTGGRTSNRRNSGRSRSGGGFEYQFDGTGFSDFFEEFFGSRQQRPGFGGFDTSAGESRGADVEADMLVSLEEVLSGGTRPVSLKWTENCGSCGGSGVAGRGECSSCHGSGSREVARKFQVRIPVGIREGQKLKVSGQGGEGGSGGNPGDLYLRVRLARHPDFRTEGNHLFHDLDLAPWEAVLGCTLSVPTLGGRVQIRIPPGAQPGQQMRVRGAGLPGMDGVKGDLHVVLHIAVPTELSEAERKNWERLAEESGFRPRG